MSTGIIGGLTDKSALFSVLKKKITNEEMTCRFCEDITCNESNLRDNA